MAPMFDRLKWALKALTVTFPTSTGWALKLPNTTFDYQSTVGDGRRSDIVMAPVRWIMRTLPEAPYTLFKVTPDGDEPVLDHPFLELLDTPNPFYDGHIMMMALAADLALTGNCYVQKLRSNGGEPVQLWWIPSYLIAPRWPEHPTREQVDDGSAFISHYEYQPGTATVNIDVSDIVHVRDGLDPHNIRVGMSPLTSLFREIFTDGEAANMTAALLKNMGVPGLIVTPKSEDNLPTQQDVAETKGFFARAFSGDKRGEPLVLGAPTDVHQFGFNPQQLQLKELRRIPEERVSAVLGIPAIVAGLGAGLDRSTFANMAEAREMAYESNIIPTQRLFAAAFRRQLLRDFEDIALWKVGHDLTEVRVLQEDENQRAERLRMALSSGAITVAEYREGLGYVVDETHEIYLRPMAMLEVPVGGRVLAPPAPPIPIPPEEEADEDDEDDDDDGPEIRSLQLKETLSLTAQQRRFILMMRRNEERLEAPFAARMEEIFDQLGESAREAFDSVAPVLAGAGMGEAKLGEDDPALIRQMLTRLNITAFTSDSVTPVYQAHYKLSAETVFGTVNEALNLEAFLDDPVAERIMQTGGKRVGLLDLTEKTRASMFRALSQGRAAGESTRELARRVQSQVSAGPWSSVQQRAMVIARTETKFATVTSSLEAYESSPVVRGIQLLDAQLGPTDEICEARNGRIVSIQEAQDAIEQEHPNGTLAVLPLT